jgi:hypothetical protein
MRALNFIISFLAVLSFANSSAQTYNEPFGKIEMSTMLMDKYPEDSTAEAVVLYRKGEFEPNQFQFTFSMRIKILTKEGFDQANFVVPRRKKILH